MRILVFALLLGCTSTVQLFFSPSSPSYSSTHRHVGGKLALTSQGVHSSNIGRRVFAQGGNIVDVAVAMSFALAVERPQSTGIGGGGFMLIHTARRQQTYALDFRETAPRRATADMFLNREGQVIADKSRRGGSAVAVPSMVAGVLAAHTRFGRLPLATVLAPVIALAETGFAVYPHLARALSVMQPVLASAASAEQFLHTDGSPYREGEILRQPALASTLRAIASQGKDGFYRGRIADRIIATITKHGGIMQHEDLRAYRVVWRKPLAGTYRGYKILSMPPPSSGGVHIVQMLNVLENFTLKHSNDATTINIIAQAMQKAFADRAMHLGDSDFVRVPLVRLLSQKYANTIAYRIDKHRARKSEAVQRIDKLSSDATAHSSDSTTHFSVMDAEGNVVVSTQTINGWFGSGLVVPDTGIVLNNEMDDFSS